MSVCGPKGRFFIVGLTILACVLVTLPATAMAQTSLGVGAGLFMESSEVDDSQRISVQETDRSFEYVSDGALLGSIRLLRHIRENVRMGGGLSYYGSYRAAIIDEDADDDDEPELYEFGPLLELFAQGEWVVPVFGKVDLILGSQVGLAVLFPKGDLQREIDSLDDEGVGVWDVPRLGYFFAPLVGGRWHVDERFSVRSDLVFRWERIHLFSIEEDVSGVPYGRDSTSSVLRTEFHIGIEVQL